jgi:tight adherence protein B
MILLSMLAAGLAICLWLGPSRSRTGLRRLAAVATGAQQRRWRGPSKALVALVAGMMLPPALLAVVVGRQAAWLSVPVMIILGTVGLIWWRSQRRRRAGACRKEVAQACSMLAGQVRIGQPPLIALRSAAEDCAVLRQAVATADLGGDVIACWHAQSTHPGQSGLDDLARAWQLSVATGSGMGEALDDVAEGLAADESLALVVDSEAAGPRASGKVMAALPLIGVGLGYLIGGDPVAFLINTSAGWACLTAGAALAALGVLWMERVADRATSWR